MVDWLLTCMWGTNSKHDENLHDMWCLSAVERRSHTLRLDRQSASSRHRDQLNPLQTESLRNTQTKPTTKKTARKTSCHPDRLQLQNGSQKRKKHSWKKVRQNKGEGNAKNERLTLASAASVFNGKSPSTRQVRVFRDDCSKDNFFGADCSAQLTKAMLTL